MQINYPNFIAAPNEKSPFDDLLENVLKGYKIQQEPEKMRQEGEQRTLANSLKQLELEHKPKEYALGDQEKTLANSLHSKALEHYEENYALEKQLKEANIKKANQPQALKGALAAAFQLRNNLNPTDPNFEKDKLAIDNYIQNLGTKGGNGIQVSSTPEGGFQVSIGGQGQTASLPGLPKLKTGESYLFDEKQQPIGVAKPMSEGEKKEAAGREFFNKVQPFVNEAQSYYSGKNSTERFENDVANYETDPAAKNRIDDLLAADSLLFSEIVKENATIGGANTNKVYERLTKSLQKSEVYPILKDLSRFQLPAGYAKASGDIMRQKLNEATDAAQNLPAYKTFYFNKDKNGALSEKLAAGKAQPTKPVIVGTANGITTIKNGNKTLRIPEKLVDKYMQDHTQPEYGVQNVGQ